MKFDTFQIMSDRILVRKCGKGDALEDGARGVDIGDGKSLAFPTDYSEVTNFAELMSVGPNCKHFSADLAANTSEYEGITVWIPELAPSQECLDADEKAEYWVYREEEIMPVCFDDNEIAPLGDMVLLELELNAAQKAAEQTGDVLISEHSVRRTGKGKIVGVGDVPPSECYVGDTIQIGTFANVMEFDYKAKTYGIIDRHDIVAVWKSDGLA